MAVSSESLNSTAVIGVPACVSEIDLNESGTRAKRALGFKVEDAQGKIYRWAHFGANTNRGLIVSNDLSESSVVDTDNAVIAPASCVNAGDCTVGSRFVEMTLAGATAGQFAGGQFGVTDDTGEGYTYDIVGNTATDDPATGKIRIELARPLAVALDATSDVCIMGSPYANLEAATTTDINVVGVAMATMAAGDYGWIMTKGQAVILDQGTTTIGAECMIGSVAGSITDVTTDAVLGLNAFTIVAGDDTGHAGVRFNFE
jgi:hypothetical protein